MWQPVHWFMKIFLIRASSAVSSGSDAAINSPGSWRKTPPPERYWSVAEKAGAGVARKHLELAERVVLTSQADRRVALRTELCRPIKYKPHLQNLRSQGRFRSEAHRDRTFASWREVLAA